MYSLTSEQKLANYEELIASKRRKVSILSEEIKNLEAKADKLRSSQKNTKISLDSAINSMSGR